MFGPRSASGRGKKGGGGEGGDFFLGKRANGGSVTVAFAAIDVETGMVGP